ncbi:MAG: hypothetical protein M1818_003496 [Claussenomyces sp. TS43310]|nr:MAG: hypothetical protein M1818_003496 [Claussenomyces sp. TS43310]
MAEQYAKDKPIGFINRIEKVAIIGAGGRVGKHFAEELVKTGKHAVVALTRAESKSKFPEGVKVVQINYDDEESIVSALKGQQFLIITLAVQGPSSETHSNLVKAAAKAGVPYIMPNAYGTDIMNKKFGEENLTGVVCLQHCVEIEGTGVSSYIAMVCGQWYEWSLALGEPFFGFDIKNKRVTFFDDGKTRVNISTWGQCGRALAALLSLKELPDDVNDESPTVSQWKNKALYIASFRISQREILDSLHRVIGTTDKDWEISYEPTGERYKNALEELKKGSQVAFAKTLYSRIFFPNGDGDFESSRGLANSLIGLPEDDLDEATKRTVEMVESGWNPFAQ